jgi:hypothetical protein
MLTLAAILSDSNFETQVAVDGLEALEPVHSLPRRRLRCGFGYAADGRF